VKQIIFNYKVDPIKQALKRPFEHYVIPRFTRFNIKNNIEKNQLTITDIYSQIVESHIRNKMIVEDVIECVKKWIAAFNNKILLVDFKGHASPPP